MNQDSSDDEDIFSCGRCKQQFSSMGSFMQHKKSHECRKAKQSTVEGQHEELTPTSRLPSTGVHEVPESIPGSSQKVISSSSSTSPVIALHQDLTFSDPDNLQPSVARLQDVLASLQGQVVGQMDFSSGLSEFQDGQALIHVFEKLLGSPVREVNLSARPGLEAVQALSDRVDGGSTENLTSPQTAASNLCNFSMIPSETASEVPPEDVSVMREQPQSTVGDSDLGTGGICSISRTADLTTGDQRPRGQPALLSDGEPSPEHLKKSAKATGKSNFNTAQKELPSVSQSQHPLAIPEALTNIQSVVCKFCSEILTNADTVFSHYVEIHKMKSGAALEFLRQSAFKRKRGRPPKGTHVRKCKPVLCPHCSVSFSSKTVCAAHIRKHHRETAAVKSSSKSEDLPSGRRRKCSRCSFQTTISKDLTAHMRSCRSNKVQFSGEASGKTQKEKSDSGKEFQPEVTSKTDKEKNQAKVVQEDAVDMEQDFVDEDEDDDDEEDLMYEKPGRTNAPLKGQVTCPECNRKVHARGLKRHQVRCANKNRFVCLLCQHKSRESYDHTVHVDNHRTWVKAQSSWINNTSKELEQNPAGEIAAAETATDSVNSTSRLLLGDSTTLMVGGDKLYYAPTCTVDLEELALITHMQGENKSPSQDQKLTATSDSSDDLQRLDIGDVVSSPRDQNGDAGGTSTPSTEQELNPVSGENKKINPRDLKCKICYTWFGRSNFPKHMLQAHNMVKRFQCREKSCKFIFAKLEEFKTHLSSHSVENMFRCGCRGCVNRRLVTPEKMNNIRKEKMRDYYKHMSHKCYKCWVKFPSQGSLDRHMKKETHHHPCSICSKIQVSKRQLCMHMVTHQAERAYLCEVCGQKFKTKRDLNKHSFSHNNIRPYQCSECCKSFSFRNKMTRHMVTVHSAKKPHTCNWPNCNRAFSRKDKLNDHAKTHQVSFPFKCLYCSKGFYRKDNLKDHEILHTREFRFRCTECNRGFMRPKILQRHYQMEHSTIISFQDSVPTQDGQTDSPNRPDADHQQISYVLCEPYVYTNIEQLASFQDNVQEAEVQRATIEALQDATAAVLGNGQSQFQIDGVDAFPVMTLGT